MFRSINNLRDFWIHATDGDLGAVGDFYVDEVHWNIPFLVMDTGNWLPGKQVVVPTSAITRDDWDNRYLHIDRTRDQIRESPSAQEGPSLARQLREIFVRLSTSLAVPNDDREFDSPRAPSTPDADAEFEMDSVPPRSAADRLHAIRDIELLRASAIDGPAGRVHDLLCDDANWSVRYVVLELSALSPGRLVPIAPRWIHAIDWPKGELTLNVARAALESSPLFDEHIDAEFEQRLHEHFGTAEQHQSVRT